MDKRISDLEDIKTVFDSFGIRFIVGWGALLGMYRDKKLIDHDDDIDLAIIDPVDFETRKKIGWMLYDIGFRKQGILFNVLGRMEELEEGYSGTEQTGIIVCERDAKFTIFFFQEELCAKHGKEYVCIPKLGALKLISTPKKFYDLTESIKIGKHKYLTPCPIKDYLEYCYENWKDRNGRDHAKTYEKVH